MGCNSSSLDDADFLNDDFIQSLPSELDIDRINSDRQSGMIQQRIQLLQSFSTDITSANPKTLKEEKDSVFLIICTTTHPVTKKKYVEKVNDSILTAKSSQFMGYQCFSLIDPNVQQVLSMIRVFLSTTKRSLFIFFNSFYFVKQKLEGLKKNLYLMWNDQKIKISTLEDSLEAYKIESSKVRIFFDCQRIDDQPPNTLPAEFLATDFKLVDSASCFTATKEIAFTFLLWRELRKHKPYPIKTLFANIQSAVQQFGGEITYKCNPETDENSPLIAVANEVEM